MKPLEYAVAHQIVRDITKRASKNQQLLDPEFETQHLIEKSLAPLRDGIELVERDGMVRREVDAHFVQYIVPLTVAGDDDDRAWKG